MAGVGTGRVHRVQHDGNSLVQRSSLTDLLRRTLDQRISIVLDADDALCLADPGQLESALLNIAINARDAMPLGGTLLFSCRAERALPVGMDLEPGEPAADGYVAIAITDSGSGMPAAVKERAFEPFFTTKEAGRGTGLGLSTVYGFARQSRGAVRLASTPGAGTTVTLYLPRVDEDEYERTDVDALSGECVPPGLQVLLVEDDAEVRSAVEKNLTSMGCAVVSCASAEQALARTRLRRASATAVHRHRAGRGPARNRAGRAGTQTPARPAGVAHIRLLAGVARRVTRMAAAAQALHTRGTGARHREGAGRGSVKRRAGHRRRNALHEFGQRLDLWNVDVAPALLAEADHVAARHP